MKKSAARGASLVLVAGVHSPSSRWSPSAAAAATVASGSPGARRADAQARAMTADTIVGAGASFPAPLYIEVGSEYADVAGVNLNYQSIGSGGGIAAIEAKTVDFGASDAPLSRPT